MGFRGLGVWALEAVGVWQVRAVGRLQEDWWRRGGDVPRVCWVSCSLIPQATFEPLNAQKTAAEGRLSQHTNPEFLDYYG